MKITDEAKEMLEEMEEGEEPVSINGISVLMEEDVKEKAENLKTVLRRYQEMDRSCV